MARREFAHSVRQGCFHREQCSPFDQAPAAMHLAKLRRQGKSHVMSQTLLPGKVMLLGEQPAKRPSLELRLHLKDSRLRRGTEIPPVRARGRQYLRGPGPFAFFREIPDAEKCNPAARCGGLPIFGRYH